MVHARASWSQALGSWQVQEECTYKNRRGCATSRLGSTDISVRQQSFPYSNTWTSVSKGA
jgi:hypothetical protein